MSPPEDASSLRSRLPHRLVAAQMAQELGHRRDVEAVLLAGSVARDEHLATSDLDLLVVGPEADTLPVRVMIDGLLVERISHTEAGWLQRLDRPQTSWLYAFSEATPLLDRGAGGRLRDAADQVRRSYWADTALRSRLATSLWHGQAKLDRAVEGDERSQGFWASLMVETLIDALYTIHHVPLPAGSRRLEHLHEVPLSAEDEASLDCVLTGSPTARISAAIILTNSLRGRLGPADHESGADE